MSSLKTSIIFGILILMFGGLFGYLIHITDAASSLGENLNVGGQANLNIANTGPYGLIVENGNVGIGTYSPSYYKLDVAGRGRFTGDLTVGGGNLNLDDSANAQNSKIDWYATDGDTGSVSYSTYDRWEWSNGRFYIMDTVPTTWIYSDKTYLGGSNGDNIIVRDNELYGDDWIINYNEAGNWGIGTTNPSYALDVVGGVKATDYYSGSGMQGITSRIQLMDGNADPCSLFVKDGLITGTNCAEGCFTGDMLISMYPSGFKPIKEIKLGDIVKSYDPAKGVIVPEEVVTKKEHFNRSYMELNNELKVTSNHHLFVNGKEWLEAGDIKLGDYLLNEKGGKVYIYSIEENVGYETVYDMRLYSDNSESHNYFVEGILAHNAK